MAFMDFELPDGGKFRFDSREELEKFLGNEQSAWDWVSNEVVRVGRQGSALNGMQNGWNNLAGTFNQVRNFLNQGNPEAARQHLVFYYGNKSAYPYSKTVRGQLVLGIKEELGQRAGLGALAAVVPGYKLDASDPEQIRGVFAAHQGLNMNGKLGEQAIDNAMAELLRRWTEQQRQAEQTADTLAARVEAVANRRRKHFSALMAEAQAARRKYASDLKDELQVIRDGAEAKVLELEKTRATYSEFMHLKAPVEYWSDKAKNHRNRAWIYAVAGLVFAAITMFWTWMAGFPWLVREIEEVAKATKSWQSGYLVIALGLFVLTVLFWIGRLISRNYVSHSHLALDASEKATMVQTYLALQNDGAIAGEERNLVLGAVFKSSSDGLVKDDGAPDLSPAALLSKMVK